MGKHSKSPSKTKGANLTLKQKEDFRNAVMAEFPDIAKNDELVYSKSDSDNSTTYA